MNQNNSLNREPAANENASSEISGHRCGNLSFANNQLINIHDDVVAGNKTTETTFNAPVNGPMHTGSGNLYYIDIRALLHSVRQ